MQNKKTTEPKKMGRPRKEIDWDQFEKICQFLPTIAEVASFFSVGDVTLQRHIKEHYGETFETVLKRFGDKTKISLRRNLIAMSEKNASVAIFLAKNLLGYRDQPEQTTAQLDGVIIVDPETEKPVKE